MSRFQPSPHTGIIDELKELKEQLNRALSANRQLETERKQAVENLERFRQQSALTIRQRTDEHLASLKASRDQTANAKKAYNAARKASSDQRARYFKKLTYQREQLEQLAQRNASQATEPTRPITSSRGQKGFLNNMKRVMGLALKNPAKVYVALTAALAALGMTVIQQQEQLNQHRTDMTRLQNQFYDQLNRTNYYRQYHDMRERAGLYTQQGRGKNPLSRAMNAKSLEEHNRKIQQRQQALGPPPDKG